MTRMMIGRMLTNFVQIIHLCYELVATLHTREPIPAKLSFWTEQVKRVHMIRFGKMGLNVEAIRTVMLHTRHVLRNLDGYETAEYEFI